MAKIRRALVSVYDKSGLVPLAKELAAAGIEILSTGGTARVLRENGLAVKEVSDYTGFPEMLDGRVKTLHPKVHGALLFLRGHPEHEAAVEKHGIQPIDLVVINLYPFEQTVAKPSVRWEEAIEQIDIGGPAMLRSAAKNHAFVTVVADPVDYPEVLAQIKGEGGTNAELRRRLAGKVFARTAAYDSAIARFFERSVVERAQEVLPAASPRVQALDHLTEPPETLEISLARVQTLRYGENPHQCAALYGDFRQYFQQLHGKELSYNNILDLTSAESLIEEFGEETPTVAILKHTNPCGVGQGKDLREAWEKAFATDRQSPFGGIIVVNRELDLGVAEAIVEIFSEVIIAPSFAPDALARLQKKKNLRLLQCGRRLSLASRWELRGVGAGSFLFQDRDSKEVRREELKVVTKRQPTDQEFAAMLFGWRVMKHVKSNAIVYGAADRTLGIGAGQMSRVDASRLAVAKAKEAGLSLQGSVVCSDAFFPFPDALNAAADSGATAAIEPGGSVRDAEVIAAADERNMAMAFTAVRHFRH